MPLSNLHSNCVCFNPAKAHALLAEAMRDLCGQMEIMAELGERDAAWKRALERLSACFDKIDEADYYLPKY